MNNRTNGKNKFHPETANCLLSIMNGRRAFVMAAQAECLTNPFNHRSISDKHNMIHNEYTVLFRINNK